MLPKCETSVRVMKFGSGWNLPGRLLLSETCSILIRNASGFNQRCLTNEHTPNRKPDNTRPIDSYPVWSPDGTRIAFVSTRERNRNWQVFVMNADGPNPVNIIKKISSDDQPSWGQTAKVGCLLPIEMG